MAESQRDRVKASKLRNKRADKLKPAERAWLTAYEARKAKPKPARYVGAVRVPAGAPIYVAAPPPPASEFTEPARTFIHETKRLDDALDPFATTWKPVVVDAGDAGAPRAPGMPPPPAAGTPLIADAPPVDAPGAVPPGADPAAVAQLQMMVVGLCMVGISSGLELLADKPDVPPMVRDMLADPGKQQAGLTAVGNAAARLAHKYNLQSIPLADEVMVGGACLASGFAWLAVQKKRKTRKPATSPTTTAATSPAPPEQPAPTSPTSTSVLDLTGDL